MKIFNIVLLKYRFWRPFGKLKFKEAPNHPIIRGLFLLFLCLKSGYKSCIILYLKALKW